MRFEDRIDHFCRLMPGSPRDLLLLAHGIRRVANLLEVRVNAALQPFDLDMPHYLALGMLFAGRDEVINPSILGGSIDANRTRMTRIMDRLSERGWVERTPSTQDRRRMDLTLTDAGRAQFQAALPAVHAVYRAAWGDVEPARVAAMLDLLALSEAKLADD